MSVTDFAPDTIQIGCSILRMTSILRIARARIEYELLITVYVSLAWDCAGIWYARGCEKQGELENRQAALRPECLSPVGLAQRRKPEVLRCVGRRCWSVCAWACSQVGPSAGCRGSIFGAMPWCADPGPGSRQSPSARSPPITKVNRLWFSLISGRLQGALPGRGPLERRAPHPPRCAVPGQGRPLAPPALAPSYM